MTEALTTDHHQRACDAVERSTPLLVEALRRAPADARPKGMRWTHAEIGAHLLAAAIESEKLVRGEPSVFDSSGVTAELDDQLVTMFTERDPDVLATKIAEATASFVAVARGHDGSDPIAFPRGRVATIVGMTALDQHLHGGQFTEAAGVAWTGHVPDMHSPLRAVLAYTFDPEAARDYRGSFTFRLKGAEPVRVAVDRGTLTFDVTGRTDCTLVSDPQTFVRFGIGVVSRARAILTGRMYVVGRKPWRARDVNRIFPAVPHGGVSR